MSHRVGWLTLVAGLAWVGGSIAWLLFGPERSTGACAPESIGVGAAMLFGVAGLVTSMVGLHYVIRSRIAVVLLALALVALFIGGAILGTLLDGWCF